jgi:hypothetical protein
MARGFSIASSRLAATFEPAIARPAQMDALSIASAEPSEIVSRGAAQGLAEGGSIQREIFDSILR